MSSRVNPSTRPKSNKDEPDEVKSLRKLYSTQLSTLKELFAEWSDEDLLFATQEAGGDLELAIDRISEGHTSQWGEVKGKKTKKPHSDRSAITQPHVDKYQSSVRNTGANERPRTSQIKSKSSRFPKPVEKPRAPASTFVKPVILDSQGTTKTYAQLASQSQRPLQDSDFTHTALRNGSQNTPDISTWSSASVTTSSTPSWGPSKPEPQGRKTLDSAQPTSLQNDYPTSSTIAKPSTQPKISWAQIVKPVAIPAPPVQAPKTNFAPEQTNQAESHIPSSETPSHEFSKPQESQSEPKQESIQIEPQEQRKPDVASLSDDGNIGTEKPDEHVEDDVEEFKNSADVVTIPAGTDGTDASDSKDHPVKLNTETSKAQALSPNTKARTMNARKFKQDSPVVMPGGNSNLERIGVQFGSLTLSSRPDRKVPTAQKPESNTPDDRISEIPILEQSSTGGPEVTSQSSVPEMQPVVHTPITDDNSPVTTEVSNTALPTEGESELAKLDSPESSSLAPENVNGANNHTNALQATQAQNSKVEMSSNNTSNQAMYPTQPSGAPNMNTFGRQNGQHNSPYLGQPHIGNPDLLNSSPYGSYMGGQPQSQFSNFAMGPMGDYGTTLYGNDAQRALMGYYADPAYGQIPSNYQRDSRLPMQDSTTIPSSTQSGQNASLTSQASPQPQSQQLQQPSYPELAGIPYYPYYYVPNQFHTPAYQQSGYGQPFMNKNIYPYYGSQQTSKPGTSATGSPYTSAAYPSNTLNQPNSYSQGPPGVGRYDDISLSGSNNGGIGSGVSEYQKGYKSDLPLQGFLGSSTGQQQGSAESSKNASGQNTHDMNSPYKNYADPSNVYNQSAQGGQYGGYQQQMYGGYQQQYAQQSQQQYQQYQMQQQNHQQQQSGGYHHQQGRSQGYWS